jgi:hypothetical protein
MPQATVPQAQSPSLGDQAVPAPQGSPPRRGKGHTWILAAQVAGNRRIAEPSTEFHLGSRAVELEACST